MNKNIILTTLSAKGSLKKDRTTGYTIYNYYFKDNEYCSGYHQQEPGAKLILSGIEISKIVILGSDITYNEETDSALFHSKLSQWRNKCNTKEQYEAKETSSLSAFLGRLAYFYFGDENCICNYSEMSKKTPMKPKNNKEDIEICFIKDTDEYGNDNISELINELRGEEDCPSYLYMDMQGGKRTSIYITNSLLQLIGKQSAVYHTELKRVVSTEYIPANKTHEIFDETDRYKIVDLVSGMNAFLNYGKSSILSNYLLYLNNRDNNVDENVKSLIDAMQNIDDAITTSRISLDEESEKIGVIDLKSAITELKNTIKKFDNKNSSKDKNLKRIFDILIDGIKADYGKLIEGDEVDTLALAEWCMKKENYITAASVLETYLPSYLVKHGILYYAKSHDELEKTKERFIFYKILKQPKDKWIFNDINHFFIKYYLNYCNIKFVNKADEKPLANKSKFFVKILKYCNYLPVKIYTNIDKEKAHEIAVYYSFVSYNRNALAHVNNDTNVTFETMKNSMQELINKVKYYSDEHICFYLKDDEIKDLVKDEKTLWKEAVECEFSSTQKYGIMNDLIADSKKDMKYYSDLYSLSGYLTCLRELQSFDNNKNKNNQQYIDCFKKNEKLSRILLRYYNLVNNTSFLFDDLSNANISKNVTYTFDKTIEEIKKTLKNYSNFEKLVKYLENEEIWNSYINEEMNKFQEEANKKGFDKESEERINAIKNVLDYYKNDNSLKEMFLWFVKTNEGCLEMKLAHK